MNLTPKLVLSLFKVNAKFRKIGCLPDAVVLWEWVESSERLESLCGDIVAVREVDDSSDQP
jgi:hypothetical protein